MNGSEILKKVLEHTKESKNSFAKKIGLHRSQNLYDIESGKVKKISSELSEKIVLTYPNFNRNWLLTGIGQMLSSTETKTDKKDNDIIPLYDVKASAGPGLVNLSENVLDYIQSEHLKGCTAAIMVSGDSMNNVIKDKDIIGLKPIQNLANVEYGGIYVIRTKAPDYELFVKYIRKHDDHKNYFILKSENNNYDDMEIRQDNIETIWKQKGIIRY